METANKTCMNCAHRQGSFEYGKCLKTGTYPDLQMIYGGRCAGTEAGPPQMALWEQRRTIWIRIKNIFNR